jgi:hypothetical protein
MDFVRFIATSALLSAQAAVVVARGTTSSTQAIRTTVVFQNGAPAPGLPTGFTYSFVRATAQCMLSVLSWYDAVYRGDRLTVLRLDGPLCTPQGIPALQVTPKGNLLAFCQANLEGGTDVDVGSQK